MQSSKLMQPRRVIVVIRSSDPNNSLYILLAAVLNQRRNFGRKVGKVFAHRGAFGPVLGLYVDDEKDSGGWIERRAATRVTTFLWRLKVVDDGPLPEKRWAVDSEFIVVSFG